MSSRRGAFTWTKLPGKKKTVIFTVFKSTGAVFLEGIISSTGYGHDIFEVLLHTS